MFKVKMKKLSSLILAILLCTNCSLAVSASPAVNVKTSRVAEVLLAEVSINEPCEEVSASTSSFWEYYCSNIFSHSTKVTNILTGNYSIYDYCYTSRRQGNYVEPRYSTHKCIEWKYKKGATKPFEIKIHCPYPNIAK